MSDKWKSLLTSRKVWLALLTLLGGILAYCNGTIGAEQLTTLIVTLVTAVIVAIGIEDHGLRSSGR